MNELFIPGLFCLIFSDNWKSWRVTQGLGAISLDYTNYHVCFFVVPELRLEMAR